MRPCPLTPPATETAVPNCAMPRFVAKKTPATDWLRKAQTSMLRIVKGSRRCISRAQESQLDVARALLAAGASTTAQNVHGNTALWTATFSSDGRGELISLLLSYGADPDSQNKYGASPRTLAAMIANFNVAQVFEDQG